MQVNGIQESEDKRLVSWRGKASSFMTIWSLQVISFTSIGQLRFKLSSIIFVNYKVIIYFSTDIRSQERRLNEGLLEIFSRLLSKVVLMSLRVASSLAFLWEFSEEFWASERVCSHVKNEYANQIWCIYNQWSSQASVEISYYIRQKLWLLYSLLPKCFSTCV